MDITPWNPIPPYSNPTLIIQAGVIGAVVGILLAVLIWFTVTKLVKKNQGKHTPSTRNPKLSVWYIVVGLALIGAGVGALFGHLIVAQEQAEQDEAEVQSLQTWLDVEYALKVDIATAQNMIEAVDNEAPLSPPVEGESQNANLQLQLDEEAGGYLLATASSMAPE
jgi:hypothetical protein